MFEYTVIIPFSIIVRCLVVVGCSKNSILSEPKREGHKQLLGEQSPLPPPHSDAAGFRVRVRIAIFTGA